MEEDFEEKRALKTAQPLVSCIMPTHNRRRFVPKAVEYFRRQAYTDKELIVIDDGTDAIADLIPSHPRIHYHRLDRKEPIGAKRNIACRLAKGEIIAHWDDDDWMAPWRIAYQVEWLLASQADICGCDRLLFYEPQSNRAWQYVYPNSNRPWVAGGTLCYLKTFWKSNPFPSLDVGEDGRFVWGPSEKKISVLENNRFYIAIKHPHNTSPKKTTAHLWHRRPVDDIAACMGDDFPHYRSSQPRPAGPPPDGAAQAAVPSCHLSDIPVFTIIMVVHNACDIVKMATLKTLQHSRGYAARLVVVDNGSDDGIERWLDMLADRGDIELIRNPDNRGHGPGIEQGWRNSASTFIVTLDSDAYPLSDSWLDALRARMTDNVKVAGIGHHRGYIHPACLMIERQTLAQFGLSFLDEKHLASRLDVAERISLELQRRGYRTHRLKRTGSLRRGSRSEPVYLGSDYEGLVHHQWYTTRADLAPGQPVDDVALEDIRRSRDEVLSAFHHELRDVTVVLGIGVDGASSHRKRNAEAVLAKLNRQDLPRWQYRTVVVEQGREPLMEKALAPLADRYLFAYNPGPYNRSWGFNIGAMLMASEGGVLCLMDADIMVPVDFLRTGLDAYRSGLKAFLPFEEMLYLDAASTERLFHAGEIEGGGGGVCADRQGQCFTTSQGGCIWVDAGLYRRVGGHDEGYRGWGYEDRDFIDRINQAAPVPRLPGRLLHLYHTPVSMQDQWALANRRRYESATLQARKPRFGDIGDPRRYTDEAPRPDGRDRLSATAGRRDWEHWHQWHPRRIEQILQTEAALPAERSMRRRLADIASQYGRTLLDVGCGPGAMWTHFARQRRLACWIGIDVTWPMIRTARRFFPTTPVCLADAGAVPFRDRSVDIVLLRHVLEHLPRWLMVRVVAEALRVAGSSVIVDFYLPPTTRESDATASVGEGFIETRWRRRSIEQAIVDGKGRLHVRIGLDDPVQGDDDIWILTPSMVEENRRMEKQEIEGRKKVSIIMPTYRRLHTLLGTISQICSQTYQNWELIVIDNHGRYRLVYSDPRIRFYTHTDVVSAAYARNCGLRYATGDLICFFDDDDDMFPDYVETFAIAFEQNPSAKLVRCGMDVGGHDIDYSYATPECCLRREFASATWQSDGVEQDQNYFKRIIAGNRWKEENGDSVLIPKALCRAKQNGRGGLRAGRL